MKKFEIVNINAFKAGALKMLVCSLLAGFIACVNPAVAVAGDDNPEIGFLQLDSCTLDLGTITADTVAEGEMRFRNTGGAPLRIMSIFSECGCTSTSYTTDSVMPGEEGVIKVSFNPKGRLPGAFRKALRIRTDAGNPRVILSVKGRVEDKK